MKWPTVPLGTLCHIVIGATPSRSEPAYWGGKNVWVTVGELNGGPIYDSREHITDLGIASSASKLISAGTLLFSFKLSIGKLGIAGCDLYTNEVIAALPIRPQVPLERDYLAYALQFLKVGQGAHIAVKGALLNKRKIAAIEIPLPPLSEQRRIVELLDQADVLRKQYAKADAKVERILPALFYKMFGDLAINPKGWDKIPLKKLLRQDKGALQSGPFGTDLHNSDFVDDGTALAVGIDNVHDTGFQIGRNRRITSEKYQQLKKYKLQPGDVLITIMGTIGRTCIFPVWVGEAICTKHVYRIQTDRSCLDPEYLCASIRFSPTVRVQLGASVTGQIVDGITSKDLKGLIINVPPLNLQNLFSQAKERLDRDTGRRGESRQKLDHLFSILLQRAFSGNLTAEWRQTHMKELLTEMKEQAKELQSRTVNALEPQLSLYQ